MDFDFDDDLFDGKKVKLSNDINTTIAAYKPKIVEFDVNLFIDLFFYLFQFKNQFKYMFFFQGFPKFGTTRF